MGNGNLSFEDGLRTITINNDPDRVIRFAPTDIGILDRLEAAADAIKARAEQMDDAADPRAAIRALDAFAREQVDAVFPEPVCDTVFGKACCVSLTPSGNLQVLSFLEGVISMIEKDMGMASRAAEKRQAKYLNKYRSSKKRGGRR